MRNQRPALDLLRRAGDGFQRLDGFSWGIFLWGTLLVVFRRHTLFLIRLAGCY
jgi:hypothetical protein